MVGKIIYHIREEKVFLLKGNGLAQDEWISFSFTFINQS